MTAESVNVLAILIYYKLKLQNIYHFHNNVLYLQDILLTCNILKQFYWTHFYNLVASLSQGAKTKKILSWLADSGRLEDVGVGI